MVGSVMTKKSFEYKISELEVFYFDDDRIHVIVVNLKRGRIYKVLLLLGCFKASCHASLKRFNHSVTKRFKAFYTILKRFSPF